MQRRQGLGLELVAALHRRRVRSRRIVWTLSALFALDSFGGGFVPQTFIAYLFIRKYDAESATFPTRH